MTTPIEGENGPLSDRLVHKVWKIRLAAYEELEKLFKDLEESNDPKFSEYGSLWKNIISDSNAAAQEKGLDALLAFLDRAKEAPKHAPLVCSLLVEKCLGGREKTKNKTTEAFLLCIEIEAIEPAISNLIKGCTHKVPKICVASLFTLKEIIRLFGIKPLPIKLIFTSLVSFFDHADGSVRDEAFALTVELHRWLGQALKPQIEKLRPAQIKDLEAAFEEAKAKGPARPERYLRSQQANMFASAAMAQAEPAIQEVDPYDMMEPVNILSQIKDEWFENVVSPKWQIRKEQLEALVALASAPRLQPGDYGEVTKVLKKLLGDANVIVVSKAATAIGLLAKGLRKEYSSLAKQVLPTLLDKFKEKKNVVVEAIHQALDTMYSDCFSLQDVIEEIVATQENKVPKVRQDTLAWITRCLKNTKTVPKRTAVSKVVKPLANFILAALDDGSPDVRDAAAITFGSLIGSLGERVLQPYLGKLDKIKLAKVKEHVPEMPVVVAAPVDVEPPKIDLSDLNDDSNENTELPKGKKPAAKAAKKAAPAAKANASDDRDSESPPPTTAKKPAPKQAAKPAAKSTAKAATAPAKKTKAKSSNDIGILMGTEEAIEKFEQMFPASSVSGLASSNWKERLSAIQEISEHIDKLEKSSELAEILVRQFSHKPGWKDSNFQVMNGMFGVLVKLAQSDAMSKAAIVAVIPGLVEKISDAKIKPAAMECLTAFAEFDSHQFVMSQLYIHTSKHKSPKVIVETETWISSAIEEFGLHGIQVKDLIDYLRECLESTNPQVKTQAIKTLVILRKFVGAGLRDFLNDIKPALLMTIDDEFNKVGNDKPAPIRTCRGLKPIGKSSGGGNSAASNSNSNDILPREDISSKITPGIIKKLSDSNWKLRKEALEEIQQLILSANKRIQPTLSSLLSALKGHINESNKPVSTATMELLGLIATATGPSIDKQAKIVAPALFSNFADNNKHIRDIAAQCLDVWVAEITLEPFIPLIATPILETLPARKELMQWLTKHWAGFISKAPKSVDMNPLVKPLVACLEDKTSDVRNLSQQFLKDVAKNVGTEAIKKQTTDLKQASKLALAPILEALKAEEAQQKKEQANKPKAVAPTKEDKSKPDALLNCNSSKQSRLAQDSQVKWAIDSPGSDLYDLLSEQMSTPSTIGVSLKDQLLSSDSKPQAEAIAAIMQFATSEHTQQVADNLDLLLKWTSLRLYDGGLPIVLKSLELLQSLFGLLSQHNYQMLDSECDIILRSLVEKLAHNDEKLRKIVQDILKLLCQLYPATKMAKLLVEYGLETKNSVATRSNSLVSLASLITTQSVDFANLCNNKSFASLAQLVGSNDSTLNSAVVDVFRNVHKHIGEDLWQYFPQDQQSQIQDALSNSSNTVGSKIPKPKTNSRNNDESPNFFKLDLDMELPTVNINAFDSASVIVPDTLTTSHSSLMRTNSLPYLATDTNSSPLGTNLTPQADLLSSAPTLIENIQSSDIPRVIECLKVLCLAADEVLIVLSSDKLIHALTQQLNRCYLMDSTEAAASYRLMKYLLNTLHKLFSIVTIAKSLSLETLKPLISQLIQSLTDKKLTQYEDGKYLSKALNLLIMKITDTIDTSSAFTILIRCLSESIPASNAVSSNPKFTELVMKCLLRLGKSLGSTIHSINLDFLFRDIHLFLDAHPPSSWKGRDDMPLRTIKTILNEVVTLKGNQVYNHLTMVPVQPTPAIISYIDLMLKSQSSKESISSAEVKTILSEIFKKIGSKDATYQGLMELYQFKKSHPAVDLVPHLQRTSQHFQEYIKKGLETIELQHQVENRGLSSTSHFVDDSDPNLRSSTNQDDDTQRSTKKLPEPASSGTNTSLQDLKARLKAAQVTSGPTVQTNATSIQTTSQPAPTQTSSSSVDALRERLARLKAQTTS